jgi:hypothetical protein
MSELSFLVSLLLDHKLPPSTKKAVAERIKEVEAGIPVQPRVGVQAVAPQVARPPKTAQSPSTQKILEEMAADGQTLPTPVPEIQAPAGPSPQAFQALLDRNRLIQSATASKGPPPDPMTGRPRKF